MDAKARVKIGSFSRGGKSRVPTSGCDHDYQPKSQLTPYGIFLPELDELFFYFTQSKVTADFILDVLEQWWISVKERFSHIRTLLINQDNPIERTRAILEHHWNGGILDSVQTALNFAQTMTWKGKPPEVKLIQTNYSTGVRLTKQEMKQIESQILRLPHLPNWFVEILPDSG